MLICYNKESVYHLVRVCGKSKYEKPGKSLRCSECLNLVNHIQHDVITRHWVTAAV